MNPARKTLGELRLVTTWLKANLTAPTAPGGRLSDEQLAENAAAERLAKALTQRDEAHAGMLVPLGETPAPANLDVLDLLVDILEFTAAHSTLPAPASCWDDPLPHLRAVDVRLRTGTLTADIDLLDRCEDLIRRGYKTLGLVTDGQILAALCPWCGGRTSKHPTGGARTLRVRMCLPAGATLADVDPDEIRWFVVCEGVCSPPQADCGHRLRGRPAWPIATEGEWLVDRIRRAEAA